MRKRIWVVIAAMALVCVPVALAASSPTVAPSATTAITDTAATLNGTVNPNGVASTYNFAWGPTDALGKYSPATPASAGSGTSAVAEHTKLTGLTPGTTYYFALEASNSSGSSSTPIETFKTAGNPPPGPTTGAASGVQRYQATMTGTIAPNNQATTYYFQYGLTSSYGLQTAAATLAAGTATVAVDATVAGLEPGATFHYRLVATHGSTSTIYGADETFETQPFPRPQTRLRVTVTPRVAARKPFRFRIDGRIGIPAGTPASLACGGVVKIAVLDGRHRVAAQTAALAPNCTYGTRTRIGRLPGGSLPAAGVRLAVSVQYRGDAYVAASVVQRRTVTVR